MAYLIFLKLKIDEVTIQGIGYADKIKQRGWLSKEDTLSQTVSTEGIMLLCNIEAMEVWEVATADIPGAFLQTYYYRGSSLGTQVGMC